MRRMSAACRLRRARTFLFSLHICRPTLMETLRAMQPHGSATARVRLAGRGAVAPLRAAPCRRRAAAAAPAAQASSAKSAGAAAAAAKRAFNFSAGPACLPLDVLQQAQAEMVDWHGSGMSVLEMSHRGPEFESIIAKAEKDLRTLMKIPDNYKARCASRLVGCCVRASLASSRVVQCPKARRLSRAVGSRRVATVDCLAARGCSGSRRQGDQTD